MNAAQWLTRQRSNLDYVCSESQPAALCDLIGNELHSTRCLSNNKLLYTEMRMLAPTWSITLSIGRHILEMTN
jgi:hypothetical protein